MTSPSSHCMRSISNGFMRTVCGGNGHLVLWSALAFVIASKFLASALIGPRVPVVARRLRVRAAPGPILCLVVERMSDEPALLARGPWRPDEVEVHWSDDHYDPPPARVEAADAAIAASACSSRARGGS